MEHVVFFSESSGEAAFRRVADLEEAVRLVESLRNERGITDVAVHALTPVPVSFRTYYRVEIAVEGPAVPAPVVEPAEPVAAAEPIPSAKPSFEVPAVEPEIEAESAAVESVAVESAAVESESVDVPALHLLPPPAVEVVEDDRDEVEAVDAELEQAVEDAVAESAEQIEDEEGGSFAAYSLELVREDEAVADFVASEFVVSDSESEGADEPVAELAPESAESAPESEDEFAAFGSYDALVPQVRPEPEVEHSLGYFAR